jgi:tRNA pseudouridine55 synthase
MNGVLVIDKPSGMTSHDVVNRVRRLTNERSVGHLGTLDPMATGVLPLVLGRLTRLAQFYTGSGKTYQGEIRFGFSTDTYDAEGDPTSTPRQDVDLTLQELRKLATEFVGVIRQVPPPFSAKKISGVPAYKLARKNQEVELQPVEVEIKQLTIQNVEGNRARFVAHVASGTYMRSIAHEMGQRLGCGAHLSALRRTSVAEFTEADAHTLDEIAAAFADSEPGATETDTAAFFVHPRRLLPAMPAVTATDEAVSMIRNGRAVNLPELSRARQVKVFRGQTELVAIATRIAGTLFQPKVVFAG